MRSAVQLAALESSRAKHAKSREKSAILKDNNRILTEQVAQLQQELDEQEGSFKRLERQLKLELTRVTQVRAAIRPTSACAPGLAWPAAQLSHCNSATLSN